MDILGIIKCNTYYAIVFCFDENIVDSTVNFTNIGDQNTDSRLFIFKHGI